MRIIELLLNLLQIKYPVVKRDALKDIFKKHLFGNLVKVGKLLKNITTNYHFSSVISLALGTLDRVKEYLKAPGYPPCSVGKTLALKLQ